MIRYSVVLIWLMGLSALYAREAIGVQSPRPEVIRRADVALPDTFSRTIIAPIAKPQPKKTIVPAVSQPITASIRPKPTPPTYPTIVKTERPITARTFERKERLPFLGILKLVASVRQSLNAVRQKPLMQNLEEGLTKPLVYIGLGIVVLFAGAFVPIDWIKIIAFFVGLILLGLGIYYLILFLQDQ